MIHRDAVRRQEGSPAREGEEHASDPLPADSLDINVEGRAIAAPDDGFGQLWRKVFRIRLEGVERTPEEIVRTWRERFGEFWPKGNYFYRPDEGLKEGEVALVDIAMAAGTRVATGIVVIDVSPTAFTFITPEGHTFAGTITFSAVEEAGAPVAQVEIILRASDPIYELGMPLGGHARENRFWRQTLRNLAAHFGVEAIPSMRQDKLDPRRHWRNATNVVHNAYLHTAFYMITRPFRRVAGGLVGRGKPQ